MRKFFCLVCLAALLTFVVLWSLAAYYPVLVDGYSKNARTPIFSAFITLGSFLLTLKTAILQRLKDGLDSKAHEEAYRYAQAAGKAHGYYDALRNMSLAIAVCVPMALLSSVLQLTLGFVPNPAAFAICIAAPGVTIGLVLYLWYEISQAHGMWLDGIEADKQRTLAEPQHAEVKQ